MVAVRNTNFIYRKKCEICNSTQKKILISIKYLHPSVWNFLVNYYENRINGSIFTNDTKYEITKCKNCGFIWQTYILNNTLSNLLYSQWISAISSLNKKRKADISLYFAYAQEINLLSKLFKRKPYLIKMLDYGMGWGYWCLMAKAFGYDVYGLEICQKRQEYAKKNGINIVNYQNMPIEKFDFINADQIFEHVSTPLDYLKQLTTSLKPNGIIKIAVPNGNYIEKELQNPE